MTGCIRSAVHHTDSSVNLTVNKSEAGWEVCDIEAKTLSLALATGAALFCYTCFRFLRIPVLKWKQGRECCYPHDPSCLSKIMEFKSCGNWKIRFKWKLVNMCCEKNFSSRPSFERNHIWIGDSTVQCASSSQKKSLSRKPDSGLLSVTKDQMKSTALPLLLFTISQIMVRGYYWN